MSNGSRFSLALLIFISFTLWAAPDAAAYGGETAIGYSGGLTGYSETWKDWYDFDDYECWSWEYFEDYEDYYCAQEAVYAYWVGVEAGLYRPNETLYWGAADSAYADVWVGYSGFVPDMRGAWLGVGHHYKGAD